MCLNVFSYVCVPCVPLMPKEAKRGHWFPGLELQVVVSCRVGVESETSALDNSPEVLSVKGDLRTPQGHLGTSSVTSSRTSTNL